MPSLLFSRFLALSGQIVLLLLPSTLYATPPTKGEIKDNAPYLLFGRYARFEPSAVAAFHGTPYLIVLNDKEDYKESPFSIYEMKKGASSKIPPSLIERARIWPRINGKKIKIAKLEGITPSRKTPGVFYAITAFDRPVPKYRVLLRFRLAIKERKKKKKASFSFKDITLLSIADPTAFIEKTKQKKWSKIEALALTPDEDALLLGVRAVGSSFKAPEYRVLILRYSLNHLQQTPQIVVDLETKPLLGRSEGIAAMAYIPSTKQYLVVTSYEDDNQARPIDQIGAHIWFLPGDLSFLGHASAWYKAARLRLKHKAEGIADLGDGRFLVVYDDDADRKAGTKLRDGYLPLRQNEAVFSIHTLPR
jgi:hypothetical protein